MDEVIPARMLNEWVYCQRLGVLEWVHGEFEHSADTVEGAHAHRRADRPGRPAPPPEAEPEPGFKTRSLWLTCDEEGLTAKLDVVEEHDGELIPVDTKKGRPGEVEGGVWDPERVQLCAQGLVLRGNGYRSGHGFIWFAGARRRVRVDFDEELIALTRAAAVAFREAARRGVLPEPLLNSPKCVRCSLAGICLPDETRWLAAGGGERAALPGEVRQLQSPRPETYPLYVTEPGAKVGVRKEELVVTLDGEELGRARLGETGQVALVGNVQISAQAVRAVVAEGVSVAWFSAGGWLAGMATGEWHKNVVLREAQYRAAFDEGRALGVAQEVVRSKVRNQRTLLRRNGQVDDNVLRELARLAESARAAGESATLLGIEGAAARLYFRELGGMFRGPLAEAFAFEGRNRRPPRDPVNALLSYGYALLTKDVVGAVTAVGFDPGMGLYHRPRYGRPALALDLMEEFRPLVVDSAVLMAVNNGEVTERSFYGRADGCMLTASGKRAFIGAYERRMEQLVTHPVFGYRATWRRVIEIQARVLGRHLLGEIPRYVPMETR